MVAVEACRCLSEGRFVFLFRPYPRVFTIRRDTHEPATSFLDGSMRGARLSCKRVCPSEGLGLPFAGVRLRLAGVGLIKIRVPAFFDRRLLSLGVSGLDALPRWEIRVEVF